MEPCVIVIIAIVFVIIVLSIILGVKKCKEKPEKMKGSGLIIEPNRTIFNFSEEIFPIISHEILNNEIIKKYSDVYQNFVKKTETEHSLETDDILVGLSYFHTIFNKFIIKYKKIHEKKIANLKNFYLKTVISGISKDVYDDANKLIKDYPQRCDNPKYKKKLLKDIIEIVNISGDQLFEHGYKLKEMSEALLKNRTIDNDKMAELITLLTPVKITEKDMIAVAKNITSTELVNKKEYEEIIGMSRDEYIKLSKELFGDSIKFVSKGEIIQTIERPKYEINPQKGVSSMFSDKDGEGREWITHEKESIHNKLAYKIKESDDNHADVIPASVISTIIQILIILNIKKPLIDGLKGSDNTNLFRFLEATRLNMVFISILSNTIENKAFNTQLSNSYIINQV